MSAFADQIAYYEERIRALHAIQALSDAQETLISMSSMISYHENQIRLLHQANQMIQAEEQS